jgi:hypothetical protein
MHRCKETPLTDRLQISYNLYSIHEAWRPDGHVLINVRNMEFQLFAFPFITPSTQTGHRILTFGSNDVIYLKQLSHQSCTDRTFHCGARMHSVYQPKRFLVYLTDATHGNDENYSARDWTDQIILGAQSSKSQNPPFEPECHHFNFKWLTCSSI